MKKKQAKATPTKAGTPPPTKPATSPPAPTAALLSTGQLATLLTLLAVLAVVPYLNTLSNEFTLDDIPIIVENPLIRDMGNTGKMFSASYWSEETTGLDRGLYRPLTVFTYAINYAFGELRPAGYHLANLALHAAATLVLFLLAAHLLGSPMGAFVAAAIFAVHPVHTEAVTSVVGRAEVLAALFFMLALWLGRAHGLSWLRLSSRSGAISARSMVAGGAAILFYFLGLLSKETAVTLPALFLLYDLFPANATSKPADTSKSSSVFLPYVGFGVVLLIYLTWRSKAGAASANAWLGFIGVSEGERILTASRVLMEYLALLAFPRTLSAGYWKPEVPIAHSVAEPLVLGSLFVWLALGLAAFFAWRRARALFLALAWFFITILPVSNLLFAIGVGKAERILYLPSAGFCLFLGGLYGWLEKKARRKWLLLLPLFPILFLGIVRTYGRNADWKDNFTLALATLKVSPTGPVFNRIAAMEYLKRGDRVKAIPLLQEAIRQSPDEPITHIILGNAYVDLRQYEAAMAAYQAALKIKAGNLDALNGLGWTQMQTGKNAEAVQSFTTMLAIDPKHVGAYQNLGAAYLNLRNSAEAARAFRQGLALVPNHAGLHFNLALTLNQLGQAQEAEQEYQRAVALDPSFKNFKYR